MDEGWGHEKLSLLKLSIYTIKWLFCFDLYNKMIVLLWASWVQFRLDASRRTQPLWVKVIMSAGANAMNMNIVNYLILWRKHFFNCFCFCILFFFVSHTFTHTHTFNCVETSNYSFKGGNWHFPGKRPVAFQYYGVWSGCWCDSHDTWAAWNG